MPGGARRGANKTYSVLQSDITPIDDIIDLGDIVVGLPHCFGGVQFFIDDTGTTEALPTTGTVTLTAQTLNTAPRFDEPQANIIIAAEPHTISWEANTIRVKATPLGVDVATHYRLVVTCNENGSSPSPVDVQSQRPSDSALGIVTRPLLPHGAFGEVQMEALTPVVQMTAVYGITHKQETFTFNGGTATASDGQFVCTSGPNGNGFGSVVSHRQAKYRAGQGLLARFTALFDTPQVDSSQRAGLTNNTDQLGFGYLGMDFGIIYNHGGQSEIQELTITTPASGSEDATITINGTGYTVALTTGTVQHNAFEIANSLQSQVPLWDFSSNDDQVVARAELADVFAGAFTFSSNTAVASFAQINAGAPPTNTLIKQADWNIKKRLDLDPSKGSVYQVQFQYLGYGPFYFSIENPVTGDFEVVHILEYGNANIVPSLSNPTFHIGWSVINNGNTTSLTVKGASAGMFNEGEIVITEFPRSLKNIQASVDTSVFTNILSFRNRLVFSTKQNRVETLPFIVTVSTDSSKGAIIEISKGAIPGGDLDFIYVDKSDSTTEYAGDFITVTNGIPVVDFIATSAGASIDLRSLSIHLFPGECFTIAARVISGSAAAVAATINWVEDQ